MKLQVKMSEPRPCLVNVAGEKRRALCHLLFVSAWTHGAAATIGGFSAGQETRPQVIVEYEDGDILFANPKNERTRAFLRHFVNAGVTC